MKIAIPYWQGRVSPVFDVAQKLLLIDIEDGQETAREEKMLEEDDSLSRAISVLQLGVRLVICGAISEPLRVTLQSDGVGVLANVCGPVDGVLNAFLNCTLSNNDFLMPGFNNWGQRNRKRHGR